MSTREDTRNVPTETVFRPNISTENQPEGAARRPSDTLDKNPGQDPASGESIASAHENAKPRGAGASGADAPAGTRKMKE